MELVAALVEAVVVEDVGEHVRRAARVAAVVAEQLEVDLVAHAVVESIEEEPHHGAPRNCLRPMNDASPTSPVQRVASRLAASNESSKRRSDAAAIGAENASAAIPAESSAASDGTEDDPHAQSTGTRSVPSKAGV
jgi:hypothetical protein